MIHTDIDFPQGLPNPLREGHNLQPSTPFLRTQMDSGRARMRRKFTSVPVLGNWGFLFTDTQALLFDLWFKNTIVDGTKWFNIRRLTPLGQSVLVCRFTAMYSYSLVGRDRWRYDLPLEIYERPMMPDEWAQFPEFITGMSIIDLAANREWPLYGNAS